MSNQFNYRLPQTISFESSTSGVFLGRDWVFQKLIREPGSVVNSFNCSLITGANGTGKSTILQHLRSNPHLCSGTLLAYYACSANSNPFDFVFSVASQLQLKIPYLQIPSREQMIRLYHNANNNTSFFNVFSNESEIASQYSVRSTIDRSDLESIDFGTTTSERFLGSISSFPIGSSSLNVGTPPNVFGPSSMSPVPPSRISNFSHFSPSCSPNQHQLHSTSRKKLQFHTSPGSSLDGRASLESANTCTISTTTACATYATGSIAQLTSLNTNLQPGINGNVFWRYVLEPIIDHGLNRWENHTFLILIDAIDEQPEVCELICRHLFLLPSYLHVIVTGRSGHRINFSRLFNGCRKIIIDDIRKTDILNDMRLFVEYEAEKRKVRLTDDTINCLCLCSSGSYLYVQLYFQVCLQSELLTINHKLPVHLNGLYFVIFSTLFDRLSVAAQLKVRCLFSLILLNKSMSITVEEVRYLLRPTNETDQLSVILKQLQELNLICIKHESIQLQAMKVSFSSCFNHNPSSTITSSPETPETPKILADSLQPVIRIPWPSMLSWLSDVKCSGARFFCNKPLGHLHYMLNNPTNQNACSLAQHVQMATSKKLSHNLQAFLYLIFCRPTQLTCDQNCFSSNADKSESNQLSLNPQVIISQSSHPLIAYIESCVQVNSCRFSSINDDSNADNTDAEFVSEMLGDMHSSDLQMHVGSFEVASDQDENDLNNNASYWANLNLTNRLGVSNRNQPNESANLNFSKLELNPSIIDPVTGTFELSHLLNAITANDECLIKMLLDNCSQLLYCYDDRGLTSLLHAINCDCSDQIVRLIVSYELDVNQPSERIQMSSLMLAAALDRLDLVEILLEIDADVHAKDIFGQSALMYAVRFGASASIIEILIDWGAKADECDQAGRSMIILCVISSSNLIQSSSTAIDSPEVNVVEKSEKRAALPALPKSNKSTAKPNAFTKLRRQMSKYPTTGKGKRRSLIECVPVFRANRIMTGSATAAQATWVKASQMLEPNNRPVRPNSLFEHRLLNRLTRRKQVNENQKELNALQVIRQLVDGGAEVDQLDNDRRGAIHWAAATGVSPLLLDYLSQLIGKKQLQQPDLKGWLPIHWAAANGHVPLFKSLAGDGLLHQLTEDHLSVLGCAVRALQFDAVIALVRRCGARLDQLDAQRRSVVHWIVTACGIRLRELRQQSKQKQRSSSLCTSVALSDCKSCESIDNQPSLNDLVDQLVELPSKLLHNTIDVLDDELNTCLLRLETSKLEQDKKASQAKSMKLNAKEATDAKEMKMIKEEEDVDEERKMNNKKQDESIENEEEEEGEADEAFEDNKDEEDEQYRRRVRMLKLLIALGADLNCRDLKGRTALHLAAWLDDRKVTQLLISDGATVDAVDSDGRTPLMFCALANSQLTGFLLLNNKAKVDWRSGDGRSILSIAIQCNHFKFAKMLLKSGRDSAFKDGSFQSLLEFLAKLNKKDANKWKSLLSRFGKSL